MLVRRATRDDIHGVASAAVAAYMDDPQDAYLYQKRSSYPTAYLKAKSSIIKESLDDPTALPVVASLEPTDEGWKGSPTIVGFCIWFREYPDEVEESEPHKKEPLTQRIKSFIPDSEIMDSFRDWINPIINSSHAKAMARHCSEAESQQFEEGYTRPRSYYGVLDMGVDPKFRRRGVARLMMKWGIEKAEKEHVPVRLSATPAGVPLYRSLGFRTIGHWTWCPNQETAWDIMQWDPPISTSTAVP